MGFGRIEVGPERFRGININGGKNSSHPASFPQKGKTEGILFVDGTLYARLNLQDGKWPDVNHSLAWSDDRGATWQQTSWVFPKGAGNFKPARFLNFGRDYSGVPKELADYPTYDEVQQIIKQAMQGRKTAPVAGPASDSLTR